MAGGKIVAIEDKIDISSSIATIIDAKGKIATPGLIDQHIHIIGAGGKNGFASMTPEVKLSELIEVGSTTVVGLLGTDGMARSVKTLYSKTKALTQEGISAYMHTGYFGLDPVSITGSIMGDLIFIDKVLGCKIALSDIRSSFPNAKELIEKLRDVYVGGLISGKKGILHIHLGGLDTKIDVLFDLVNQFNFPIQHISPTHIGRTKDLFDQGIEFAKLGGVIDITTGASKYTAPYKSVLYALENNVPIENITFSSDGHAGLSKMDKKGNVVGYRTASFQENLNEMRALHQKGNVSLEDALKVVTLNPANNLGLQHKGRIQLNADADICLFDEKLNLLDVFAKGKHMMTNKKILVKGNFES